MYSSNVFQFAESLHTMYFIRIHAVFAALAIGLGAGLGGGVFIIVLVVLVVVVIVLVRKRYVNHCNFLFTQIVLSSIIDNFIFCFTFGPLRSQTRLDL